MNVNIGHIVSKNVLLVHLTQEYFDLATLNGLFHLCPGEAFPPTIFTYIGDKFTHGEYQFNDFTPIFNPPDDVPSRELKSVCGEDEACM